VNGRQYGNIGDIVDNKHNDRGSRTINVRG
jgi:hypothetical protein